MLQLAEQPDTAYPLTVGKSGDYYTFKDSSNKYIAFTPHRLVVTINSGLLIPQVLMVRLECSLVEPADNYNVYTTEEDYVETLQVDNIVFVVIQVILVLL